jgi:quercetin dioxygenase-like cupin family protein
MTIKRIALLSLAISTAAYAADSQIIYKGGAQPSSRGPAEYFDGQVTVEPLFPPADSAPYSGAYVSFEAGARSAWHTHPTGQRLIVTAGSGWTQQWGGPVTAIRAGDSVWCPPGVKHWHGATRNTAMTHIALTGTVNGKNVEWLEKVSDSQYPK